MVVRIYGPSPWNKTSSGIDAFDMLICHIADTLSLSLSLPLPLSLSLTLTLSLSDDRETGYRHQMPNRARQLPRFSSGPEG